MLHAKRVVLALSLGVCVSLVGAQVGRAQNYALPKGSSLAATPPIDQRGKQFRALSHAQRLKYIRQGYRGPGWRHP